MPNIKHDRIQEQIKELASQIVLFRLKDPRLGFITITKVDLSPDLRAAKVYYSVLGSDVDMKLTAQAIQSARGHVQREVAKHIHLRFAPSISFVFDDYPRKSIELSRLIDEAVAEDLERHKDRTPEEPPQEEGKEQEEAEPEAADEQEDADDAGKAEGDAE